MSNPNFDTLLSTTLNNHLPKLIDNVFSARPLFHFLKEAGQVRVIEGGAQIVIPLLIGQNGTASSYSGYDPIAVTPSTGITSAQYAWKQYAATVAINGLEEAQNASEQQIIDLLEAKVMQAEETIAERLDEMLIISDGSGNGGKDWLGLRRLVKEHNTASLVGGIQPSTNTYWQSNLQATAEPLSISNMTTAFNNVSVGNDQPSMVLTTQTLYERYESLLQPQLRFADSKTADAGFQNLLFKGSPVLYDRYVVAGDMFFLNMKYLRLVGHKDKWFTATPFVRPNNIDARYSQILAYGEFTVSNRARQAVLTNKT